jgi:DNA-binding NarL/FixJ family response regulator
MERQNAQKGLILLVDDDVNLVTLLTEYLASQLYEIVSATNGAHAMAILHQVEPDLIITDVMMPEVDGYQLVEMVRNTPQINWIPVIFLSARSQSQDRVKGLSVGGNAYLVKPFALDELSAQIESSLRSSYLIQQNRIKKSEIKMQVPEGVKLTQAELLIAQLVARGMSNNEIAQKLSASKRTIESHISHMLKKTALTNRTELSRWILESGME